VHRSPWKLTPYANPALQQIVSALVRRRKLLLVLYLALVSLWFGAALQLSVMVTDIAPMVIGHNASESDGARVVNVIIAAVLLALQAAFLFGAGRVRLDRHTPPQRLVVTVAIFALLMSVLTGVAVATVLQMIGRLDNDIVARPNLVNETTVLAIMGSSWTLWALIGWLAVRDVDRPTALSRLTVGLLAGSWIEFYAALLIELASRERTEACPCASGSWIGLVAAGPIAIWALGPGLFLIYLRARRLRAQESLSALRVLRRKSRRGRTSR
jgi:MFS family permease